MGQSRKIFILKRVKLYRLTLERSSGEGGKCTNVTGAYCYKQNGDWKTGEKVVKCRDRPTWQNGKKTMKKGEIWGSQGGEYKDDCLLACCTVQSGRCRRTFQGYLLPLSSGR
jgi:hypothetical protein